MLSGVRTSHKPELRNKVYIYFKKYNPTIIARHGSTGQGPKHPSKTDDVSPGDHKAVKSFKEIPGPRGLFGIGTLPYYLSIVGKYSFKRLHWNGLSKYREFGPLVREEIVRGTAILWIYHPEDIQKVFAHDGKYPCRRSHLALQKYRLDRPSQYSSGGLLPTNGEEWWRIRRASQKVMTKLPCVRAQLPATDQIAKDLINLISKLADPQTKQIDDLLFILRRAFLELTVMAAMNTRLGCLNDKSLPEECIRLIKAAEDSNKAILGTDNGVPIWRIHDTQQYKKLIHGQDEIYKSAIKFVTARAREIGLSVDMVGAADVTDNFNEGMLDYFLLHSGLDLRDIVTVISDTLLAGIDTGAYSLSFVLYHLSKNPDKQKILHEEACSLLPDKEIKITPEILSRAKYTKAVVKESLRLNPVSVGIGRIAGPNLVLRGYSIPEGTVLVTQNQVTCKLPQYFQSPDKFIPERWLQKDNAPDRFLLLPFGHGPRSCIGRRMAEQNLYTLMLHICRNYNLTWSGRDLDCYSYLINEPDGPLTISFNNIE